jgi:hypothetical protein
MLSKISRTTLVVLIWATSFLGVSASPTFNSVKRQSSCPGFYNFSIPSIDVIHHRSASEDTIYIAAAIAVAGEPTYNISGPLGKHGNGDVDVGLIFSNIAVADDENAVFAYVLTNNGHATSGTVEQQLATAVIALAERGAQFVENVPDTTDLQTTLEEGLGLIIGAATLDTNPLTLILGVLADIGITLDEIFTDGCDGPLGAGAHAFSGAGICSSGGYQGTDQDEGDPDEEILGIIPGILCSTTTSLYDVSWSVS